MLDSSDSSSSTDNWEANIDFSKGIESPIEILIDDVFFIILSYLNFADRIRIERVSHKWRRMSQQSWYQVNKLDFSLKNWGIIPIHKIGDCNINCLNASKRLNELKTMGFCSKVLKKISKLCANTLTHCNFDAGDIHDSPSTIEVGHLYIGPEVIEMIVNKDALKSLILKEIEPEYNRGDIAEFIHYLTEFKNLEYFECSLNGLTDDMFKKLTYYCRKLKSITFKGSTLTDKCLIHLKSLPNLEHLNFYGCEYLSGKNLHHLSNLKSLDCSYNLYTKENGLIKLLNSSQSLETLKLLGRQVTIDFLKAANLAMKNRTNNRSLEILLHKRFVIPHLEDISPLLKLVN